MGCGGARALTPCAARAGGRFSPVALDASDIKRFHGIDERISIDSYVRQHAFYARVMEEAAWK